ncbi:MAG: hypothetical protein SGBAC_001920 [Bacillariaceae sp.]
MATPHHKQGENAQDIDSMLTELKDIIHQSQKKQKERRQSSTSRRRSADSDFLVDALTRQLPQSGEDSNGPLSPPFEQEGHATSPQRTSPPAASPEPRSGITFNDDVSSATKKVNESSNNFIQRIRDVANKRKLSMTRSRDNLKAMQQEKLQPIDDEVEDGADADDDAGVDFEGDKRVSESQVEPKSRISTSFQDLNGSATEYHFKARPVPETTGMKGVGGLKGVPKVAKRPTTTPFSPLLGRRRPEKVEVKALEEPKTIKPAPKKKEESTKRLSIAEYPKTPQLSQSESPAEPVFKARPMPSFVGRKGRGGLTGVPKVQKRPLTVPRSPVLGVRRSSSMNKKKSEVWGEKKPIEENSLLSGSSLISRGSDLRGLVVLESPQNTLNEQPAENDENQKPRYHHNNGFQLQSTARAKQRADYNERRDENMKKKKEQDLKSRQREVRKMEKELMALRTNL